MYAFWLGREYKLSLAEIHALFPSLTFEFVSKDVAIVSGVSREALLSAVSKMGGSIKLIELFPNYRGKVLPFILESAEKTEGKFRFGLSYLGNENGLKPQLLQIKKALKISEISGRFVNKDFKNLSSAQILGENLVERQSDFTLISAGELEYFGKTVWVQDIEAYSKRDYGKTRDMIVGMLPPKLAQMMLNIAVAGQPSLNSLSKGEKKLQDFTVYDPFCGLGTVLLESIYMGNSSVYGSDISHENVEKTKENINYARKNFKNSVKTAEAFVLDARGISSSPVLKKIDIIVTEGYLGQIFQKYSITEKKISEEKEKLGEIYTKFFEGLRRANFKGNIVISFPFWDVRGKYFYFNEIYAIIEKYCEVQHLLPYFDDVKHTKSGSLLYKRNDQIVGREIFKLKFK